MADVTGGPVVTNASPFAVPADLTALKDHFGAASYFSVANAAALPGSGNWAGRILRTADVGALYVHDGTAWALFYQPWTTYTPTPTNVTGGTVTAEYQRVGKSVEVRIRHVVGTVSSQPTYTLPVTGAYVAPEYVNGQCILYDVSASSESVGIIRLMSSATVAVYASAANGTYTTIGSVNASLPFVWAASDYLTANFTYRAA